MIEWLKELELEFIIIFGLLAILVLISVVIVIKAQRTLNLIGRRALILTEDLVKRDGIDVVDIMVANTSYVNVEAAAIGLIYMKKLLPLKEENTIVLARDSHRLTKPLEEVRRYTLGDSIKVKKIKVYVEDSLGRRSFVKAKNSMRMLKKIIKAEQKAKRIEEKRVRFETGHYRFFERIGLIFQVIFSPFTKLFRSIRVGLNRKLKQREERLILKKKEMDHQSMLREVAEEEKREEDRAKLEKRLFEEKKKANIEARMAALKRKEEARIQEEQLRKSEEEMKLAEAEAALHESEVQLKKEQQQEVQNEEQNENIEEKQDLEKDEPFEESLEEKREEIVETKPKTKKKKANSNPEKREEKVNPDEEKETN